MDWVLRDYKVDGQLGLESTIDEYITKLVAIFDEIKRVLKKMGTCWVVIGDTYSRAGSTNTPSTHRKNHPCAARFITENIPDKTDSGIPEKSLCMIPERFAISMIDHGWILRNKIIWYKPNCMPSSAKDRFTVDWEYVYFFTKSQRYYFETQYEKMTTNEASLQRYKYDFNLSKKEKETIALGIRGGYVKTGNAEPNPLGRMKRCVWKISTKPFSGAHFAVFTPQLIEPMIKAGCPEYICNKCDQPRKLVYEETRVNTRPGTNTKFDFNGSHNAYQRRFRPETIRMPKLELTDCGCNAGFHSGIILDPFFGAGTVGLVALQNGRDFVGIELSPDYVNIAEQRLKPLLEQTKLVV